ncbi:uncharacterized protein F4812DRAFT_227459 [Daldinia caldariorum]|uniref:uncharacterized protein n=1 Tax=Daldinia caldariorum TaxID=326644 RepID=UPI0020078EF1|nr:uncharacterized protein F4812DRAFT_227459 [Daldinia caldariorum]KAI1463927.1 hypothetical protein F4812DRAFT_227459 [Daldinia caldariorum]
MAASPLPPHKPVKYRTSCDRCQNIKLRCVSKGVRCIYSPLRRMGRPKKVDLVTSTSSVDESPPSSETIAPAPSNGTATDCQRGSGDGNGLPQKTDFASIGLESYGASTSQSHLRSWDPSLAGGLCVDHHNSPISNDIETSHHSHSGGFTPTVDHSSTPRHEVDSWGNIPTSNTGPFSSGPPNATPRSAHLVVLDGPIGQALSDSATDCYTAILMRIAKLEQALNVAPCPPPIDLALEAERDFRALKQCLFSCTGHANRGRSCLASDRPVLLSLSILVERVIAMLEENFRFAASGSNPARGMIQDPCSTPLQGTMARRLERSFRSILDQPCIFPIPSANLHIRIGDFIVENAVKARCVVPILRLRIQKIQTTLREMERVRQGSDQRDSLCGPLDWGDSAAVLGDAARLLIQDLLRRMESLQGGMGWLG